MEGHVSDLNLGGVLKGLEATMAKTAKSMLEVLQVKKKTPRLTFT